MDGARRKCRRAIKQSRKTAESEGKPAAKVKIRTICPRRGVDQTFPSVTISSAETSTEPSSLPIDIVAITFISNKIE